MKKERSSIGLCNDRSDIINLMHFMSPKILSPNIVFNEVFGKVLKMLLYSSKKTLPLPFSNEFTENALRIGTTGITDAI